MYITNIWGIFFTIYIPIIISIVLTYLVGKEEGKKINNQRRRK